MIQIKIYLIFIIVPWGGGGGVTKNRWGCWHKHVKKDHEVGNEKKPSGSRDEPIAKRAEISVYLFLYHFDILVRIHKTSIVCIHQ